jgi:predicted HNH restriction endonuclease
MTTDRKKYMKEFNKKYREMHKEQCRGYSRKYRSLHKEQIQKHGKEYYQLHKKQRKEYGRKYCQEHPEQIKKYDKRYYQIHKEQIRGRRKKYYQQHRKERLLRHKELSSIKKAKIIQLIGDRCKTCGRMDNVEYHEIHGKIHTTSYWYILNHVEDFIPLCSLCHRTLHRVLKYEKLQKLIIECHKS